MAALQAAFLGVRCVTCRRAQVVQARKDRRFACRLCGQRQAVQRVLAASNDARDVRAVVQELSVAQGEGEAHLARALQSEEAWFEAAQRRAQDQDLEEAPPGAHGEARPSRWTKYLSQGEASELEPHATQSTDSRVPSDAPSLLAQTLALLRAKVSGGSAVQSATAASGGDAQVRVEAPAPAPTERSAPPVAMLCFQSAAQRLGLGAKRSLAPEVLEAIDANELDPALEADVRDARESGASKRPRLDL